MRAFLALVLLAAVAAPAQAQMEAVEGDLTLSPPFLTGEAADGLAPGNGFVGIPWTLTFDSPATAAAELAQGEGSLTLELQCNVPVTATPATLAVEHVPGQAAYGATAEVAVDSTGAVGYTEAVCTASGSFTGATSTLTAQSSGTLRLLYASAINVTAGATDRKAGPQKQMAYPLDLRNDGAARTMVRFELVGDAPRGKWAVILPEPVILDAGQSITSVVTVSTPFENGYNKGSTDFTVRVVPMPVDQDDVQGTPVDVPLHAGVDGFYVPGPSPALVLVGLAAMGVMLRRR